MAEGVRTVETLLHSSIEVIGVLTAESLAAEGRVGTLLEESVRRGIPVDRVSDGDFASAADTDAPQGILAIASIPEWTLPELPAHGARILVLDALQDPGNVGTVVRTAAALGVTATVALPGTVDLWNAKVVRSSMGALFHHPVLSWSWEELTAYLSRVALPLWGADMTGDPIEGLDASTLPPALALVVSNEGAGLSPQLAAAVSRRLTIPMAAAVESLNVAVATGILLQALRPPLVPLPASPSSSVHAS